MINFLSFRGYVTLIRDFWITSDNEDAGCYKMISLDNGFNGQINFIISPDTYFVDHVMVGVGDWITGYIDGDAPVPLIYPPQYRALVVVKENPTQQVKVDYFNTDFVSSDGQLKLNIAPSTEQLLTNGQRFTNNPANRNLIVIYGQATKSLPAQTTPYKIIVLC